MQSSVTTRRTLMASMLSNSLPRLDATCRRAKVENVSSRFGATLNEYAQYRPDRYSIGRAEEIRQAVVPIMCEAARISA